MDQSKTSYGPQIDGSEEACQYANLEGQYANIEGRTLCKDGKGNLDLTDARKESESDSDAYYEDIDGKNMGTCIHLTNDKRVM